MRTRIAFDTEDVQGDLKLAVFFDGNYYYVGDDRFEAQAYIDSVSRSDFWSHNLEYDLCNVYRDALSEIDEYIYSGTRLIMARRKSNMFYDTMNHYPTSLKVIGSQIGLEKIETKDFINLEYCMRDVDIVSRFLEILESAYGEYGVKIMSTSPSNAISIFKSKFYTAPIFVPNPFIIEKIKAGYYGGRCEIFRMGEVRGDLRKYDINSLYPAVMLKGDFPFPDRPRLTREIPAFGMVRVRVQAPDQDIPILPYRHHGELLFPVGVWESWYPVPLLEYALDNGYRVLRVLESVSYNGPCRPFVEYVSDMYPRRSKGELNSFVYKRLLNSLYGKFAQGNVKTIVTVKRNDLNQEYIQTEDVEGEYPKWANYIWSAYITGYALIEIHKWLIEAASVGQVLYCDTDSVILKGGYLHTGIDIGQMKLEESAHIFEARQPKVYRFDNRYTVKGVPQSASEAFFSLGQAEYTAPTRLRESFINGIPVNTWTKKRKTRRKAYSKRKVLHDGRTLPWTAVTSDGETTLV